MEIEKLNYFGTNTTTAGHYFWQLGEGQWPHSALEREVRFNPEGFISGTKDGYMNLITINGLNIIAIAGSPYDKRSGCKSVFWAHKGATFQDIKDAIHKIPAAYKIIAAMPFELHWPFK